MGLAMRWKGSDLHSAWERPDLVAATRADALLDVVRHRPPQPFLIRGNCQDIVIELRNLSVIGRHVGARLQPQGAFSEPAPDHFIIG